MFESIRRDLSWTPRWAIIRCNCRQSVAEHCYFATAYALKIAELIGWPQTGDVNAQRLQLVAYLLRHDEDEAITGDVPGPVKKLVGWDSEPLASMLADRFGPPAVHGPSMKAIKRVADLLDECMYLAGEINSGNRSVETVLEFAKDRLVEAVRLLPANRDRCEDLWHVVIEAVAGEIAYRKNVEGFLGQAVPVAD